MDGKAKMLVPAAPSSLGCHVARHKRSHLFHGPLGRGAGRGVEQVVPPASSRKRDTSDTLDGKERVFGAADRRGRRILNSFVSRSNLCRGFYLKPKGKSQTKPKGL